MIAEHYVLIIIGMFLFVVTVELLVPATQLKQSVTNRWLGNFSLGFLDAFCARASGYVFGILLALFVGENELGLFNYLSLSLETMFLTSFLLLDLKQWVFHWLMHVFPWLWRFHQVHHSDTEFDLSTGFRFHPVEAILNQAMFLVVIIVFGIAVEAIVVRGVLLFFVNFFTHANANLHPILDGTLRILFVTPSMHRIHHSRNKDDTNKNFGVIFSFWDRFFGTYRNRSLTGEELVPVGLERLPDSQVLNLWELLLIPFGSQESIELDDSKGNLSRPH